MSLLDSYRNSFQDYSKKISASQIKKSKESENISKENSRIQSLQRQIRNSNSLSTVTSKMKEIERCNSNIAKFQANIAKIEKEIASFENKKNEYSKKITNEETKISKQNQLKTDRANREQARVMANLSNSVRIHDIEIKKLKELPKKIKVLFMASNPRDQHQLSLDIEVRSIEEQILKAQHRDSIVFESKWAVRPGDILHYMNTCEPTIVHFSGHGSANDELVLMGNNDETRLVSLDAIVQAMSVANDNLRLVFFNTCFSYNQASRVTEHVECAIGMIQSISDEAAQKFSAQFYSSISFGHSIQKSFNQAKAALMLEGIDEMHIPQLYVKDGLSADDIYLLSADD
ncbi:CHAT domain-containing protein [Acinetobacter pittii]|uniref:CHAT domain-containing protein n=1 Tax=Acinetobacter pittii TaxID=48296 RepID=UPI00355C996C